MEISTNDLRDDIGELALADPRFAFRPPATMPGGDCCCYGVYVIDVLFNDGAWSAILQAIDGKFYSVPVTLNVDGEAAALGAAQQVEPETNWEPLSATETENFSKRMIAAATVPTERAKVFGEFESLIRARAFRPVR